MDFMSGFYDQNLALYRNRLFLGDSLSLSRRPPGQIEASMFRKPSRGS